MKRDSSFSYGSKGTSRSSFELNDLIIEIKFIIFSPMVFTFFETDKLVFFVFTLLTFAGITPN